MSDIQQQHMRSTRGKGFPPALGSPPENLNHPLGPYTTEKPLTTLADLGLSTSGVTAVTFVDLLERARQRHRARMQAAGWRKNKGRPPPPSTAAPPTATTEASIATTPMWGGRLLEEEEEEEEEAATQR